MKAQAYKELGLNDQEYKRILKILKREPTPTELAMFSVEWSEHCGYPRSRKWLKLFPQTGKYQSLVGEDAGGTVSNIYASGSWGASKEIASGQSMNGRLQVAINNNGDAVVVWEHIIAVGQTEIWANFYR